MQSAKETASNVAASAKSGMEKTKATMQEKGERMSTRDPVEKEMATDKKDESKYEAEREKQKTRQHYAQAGTTGVGHGGTGGVGAEDPNVAGGASTGYGSGNTI